MIWQASEWQGLSGRWYCNCIDKLGAGSGTWYLPARILGLTPADFINFLFKNFKPDYFIYDEESCFCSWSWKNQASMRAYKNYINKEARKMNFQI